MATKKKDTTSNSVSKPKAKKTATKAAAPKKTGVSKETKFSPKATYLAIRANISKNRTIYSRYVAIILIIGAVGTFLFINKNWFVAAVINNQPITTVEYYQNLKAKDGKEVLNQIIRDRLITQEANKKGIVISQEAMDKKISEIEKQLGGQKELQDALQTRGINQKEFENQIRVQLMVEKLLTDQIKISDKEVEEYIAKNKDSGALGVDVSDKEAVRKQLQSEKLNEKFQSWYSELEKNAKIYIFI